MRRDVAALLDMREALQPAQTMGPTAAEIIILICLAMCMALLVILICRQEGHEREAKPLQTGRAKAQDDAEQYV